MADDRIKFARASLVKALNDTTKLDEFQQYGEGYTTLRNEVRKVIDLLVPVRNSIPHSYRGEGNNDIG